MNSDKDPATVALGCKGGKVSTRKPTNLKAQEASHVSRDHKRTASSDTKRVKVTVPSRDAPLVKAIAGVLRSDSVKAELIRQSLHSVPATPKAKTGAELVAFLRASPLTETELSIERDSAVGHAVDLG